MAESINGLADQQPADPLMALFGQIDAQYARLEGVEGPEEYDRILADIEVALPPQQRGSQLTIEAVPAVDPNHTPLSQQHFDDRPVPGRRLPVDDLENDDHPMGEDYPDGDVGAANRAARIQRALAARENPITDGPELEALKQRNDRINARNRAAGQTSSAQETAQQRSPDQDQDQDSDDALSPSSRVVPPPPQPVPVPTPAQRAVPPAPPAFEPSQPDQEPVHPSTDQPASSQPLDQSQEAAPEKVSFEPDRVAFDQALTRYGYANFLSGEIPELDYQLQRLRGRELRAFDYDKFVAAWVRRMREGQAQDPEDQSPTPPSLDVARKGTQSVVDGVGHGRGVHHEEEDDEGDFDDNGEIKSPEDMTPDELQARIQELEAGIPAVETVAAEYDTNVEANRKKLERMWEAFVDAGNDEKVAEVERLLNAITLSEEMRDKNKPQQ